MAIRVKIRHDGKKTKAQLEAELNAAETAVGPLVSIEAEGNTTLSTHEQASKVARGSLILELDPEGRLAGPEDSQLVARGVAVLEGNRVRLAVFRIL
jgi:hypothetical protein